MANCDKDCTTLPVVVNVLREILTKFSTDRKVDWKKISICRRARDLKDGEFVIPKGSTPNVTEESPSILLDYVESHLTQLSNVDLPCDSVDSDKFNHVRLHVNRPRAFANVISQVERKGENYGRTRRTSTDVVAVSLADLMCNKGDKFIFTPAHLRHILVLQHVQQLLLANGSCVHQIPVAASSQLSELCSTLDLTNVISSTDQSPNKENLQNIVSKLQACKYREHLESSPSVHGKTCESISKQDTVVVNLRHFISETGASTGKMGYDTNLSLVDVYHEDGATEVIEQVGRLQHHILGIAKVTSPIHIIHIVSESRSYTQQQIDLLCKISGECGLLLSQSHLVLGSVTGRAGKHCTMTAQEFAQLRLEQMKDASVMKYGEEVQGAGWETTLAGMTSASIAFEMLNTASRNSVKLDLSPDDHMGSETRSGAFVMYSCARLATLFRHFQEAVEKGVYPPLPSIEDVKFETLREEEEWEILFNYISTYPDVVAQCVERVQPSLTDIHAKIHTHKISNFLINFSRSLSSYYSRVHILGDGKTHLLPVMFARLYLMKAAHQILQNGLHLMGIQPPSQL